MPASTRPCRGESVHTRERVLDLISRHGWNATAFQTLQAGYSYFFHESEACVAYVDTGAAWVVAGAPIAAPESLAATTAAFVGAARSAGKRCCFFAVEERFQEATGATLRSLPIGEQPVWNPGEWGATLSRPKSLREQLRRARAKGVEVRRISPEEVAADPTDERIARLVKRWLATRSMATMGFLVRVEPFSHPGHRRLFVAAIGDDVVGLAGVVPVPARAGWFIENLIRDPSAPNGTSELLVDAVMRWAAEEGSSWLTLGLAPLAGDVPGWLRIARQGASPLYDFRGLTSYKAKLHPTSWSSIHLSYPPSQGALVSVLDALAAFASGRLFSFALHSLLRGPSAVLRLLALLLAPWTLLLALAPAERWFGSVWLKWAWIAFDVALMVGILRLLRRPTRHLSTGLSVAVTVDAVLTLTQAALWNLPRATTGGEYTVIAVACAAPTIAATVLWGATQRTLQTL
jgi:phosphatidylglycerol lysyltransferase